MAASIFADGKGRECLIIPLCREYICDGFSMLFTCVVYKICIHCAMLQMIEICKQLTARDSNLYFKSEHL